MNEEYSNPYWNGLSAGLTAGQSFGAPKDNFQMSNGGVLGGAASGAMSGFSAGGPVGGVIGALTGGITSFFKQDKALKEATENVNTNFTSQVDAYGRPVYDGSQYAQGFQDLNGLMEATTPGAHALRPKRRRQMEDKARELHGAIRQGQQGFNQSEGQFRNRQIQFNEYLERVNKRNNLY